MIGRFSDENLVLTAELSGGDWAEGLGLANLKDQSRFVSRPARQLNPALAASGRIDVALAAPRVIDLAAVLFHTLGLSGQYRLSVAAPGGSLDAPAWSTGWRPVWSRFQASEAMAWETPEWWLGSPTARDIALFQRHLFIAIDPAMMAAAIRLELTDAGAAWFDVGGLWLAGAWSPQFNIDWGRELALDPRTVIDEAPGGRNIAEERSHRRRLTVNWSGLTQAEAYRLFDAGARCGSHRPVLFAPQISDAVSTAREAWPATFQSPPAPQLGRPYQSIIAAAFKEIIA